MGDLEQCEEAETVHGMDGRKPRHIFTPEERARGHKLTREDRVRGGIAANRIRGAKGGKAVHAKGTAHKLTSEDRRRGGLATAAKRRAQREKDLIALGLEGTRIGYEHEQRTGRRVLKPEARVAYELGASLAGKLFVDPPPTQAYNQPTPENTPEAFAPRIFTVDAFTLSALKRFRLGPMSPLSLTRSQRSHATIMAAAGYLEADGESMLRLTGKGWDAINATPDE
jgi:hypothetical protein